MGRNCLPFEVHNSGLGSRARSANRSALQFLLWGDNVLYNQKLFSFHLLEPHARRAMWRTNPMLLLALFAWCILPRHDEAFHLLESHAKRAM